MIIPGDDPVSLSSLRTPEKHVVRWIGCNERTTGRSFDYFKPREDFFVKKESNLFPGELELGISKNTEHLLDHLL